MKFLLSFILVIGSLIGIVICFLSNIVVDSSFTLFDGIDMSLSLGIFLVAVLLGGLSLMFSHDSL